MLKQTGIGLLGATLLLAGCNSSNNDSSSSTLTYDGPTAPVAISSTNAVTVTGVAASQASAFGPGSSNTVSGVSISTDGETQPELSLLTRVTQNFDKQLRSVASSTSTALAGIATTETIACNGGGSKTVTSTYDLSDPMAPIVPGDTATVVFNDCLAVETDSNGGTHSSLTSGAASIAYNSYSYTDSNTFDYSASLSYDNYKVTDNSNGLYDWVSGVITQARISQAGAGTPVVFTLNGDRIVSETNRSGMARRVLLTGFSFINTIDFSILEFSFDNDFTVASALIGGSVTVTTVSPFKIDIVNDSYPYTGQLIATGVGGASVKLTVVDNTTVTLEYDFDADGIFGNGTDPAMQTVAWSSLN